MPEASTPLTVGLFMIAAFGFTASTGFLLWLWRQLRGLKDEILALVKADTERTTTAIRELSVQIAGVDGKNSLLRDRLHALELDLAKARTEFAERYMSKESATSAIGRVETAVTDLRRDIGERFNAMESHMRREASP